jgi:hypothetical protein
MHATVLTHHKNGVLPRIKVTVVAGEHDIGLRISDQGTLLNNTSPLLLIIAQEEVL